MLPVRIYLLTILCFFLFAAAVPLSAAQKDNVLNDEDISQEVLEELFMAKEVSAHLLDVETNMGVVTLSGQVDNLLAKERAIELAKTVKGVRSIVDQIEVKAVPREDEAILSDVEKALLADPATEAYEITPTIEEGVVTLDGTVSSWPEKELAETVAKGVRGILGVRNNIDIEYERDRSDSEIKKEIEQVLRFDTFVDPALIDVAVDNGRVVLSGTVGSAEEKSHATADAWVAGVTAVDAAELLVEEWAEDEMKKESPVHAGNGEIRQAVIDALLFDPRVSAFTPEVEVENGVVTLSGVVSNLKAKRAAEKDAENTIGVWRVKNFIRVRPEEQPSDATISSEVKEALARDPYLQRDNIDVFVQNGKVYLSGAVNWFFKKSRAGDLASRVKGVIDIENNIVSNASWEYKSDWEIEQDVQNEFFWDPLINSDDLTFTVEDGVVTIEGTVPSFRIKQAITEEAYQGGAKHVRNRVKVAEETP